MKKVRRMHTEEADTLKVVSGETEQNVVMKKLE
jgi:hypothetical protein